MKTLTISILSLIPFLCFAQDEANLYPKNELSLNTSAFIKEYLSFSDQSVVEQSPILVTYKRFFKKMGLRSGIGFSYRKDDQNDFNGKPFLDREYSIDLRAGVEWRTRVARKWIVFYGVEAVYFRQDQRFLAIMDSQKPQL